MSTQFFSFSDDTPFSTEAVLANASSSHYEEDWPSIPHTHAFTELFYVSEGSGEFLIENQHFSIKKDDLIIVNPHIQHTEISLSASPLSYYTVGVDGISFSFHAEGGGNGMDGERMVGPMFFSRSEPQSRFIGTQKNSS